jgi:hypothetical protein
MPGIEMFKLAASPWVPAVFGIPIDFILFALTLELVDAAKLGILAGSLLPGVIAAIILTIARGASGTEAKRLSTFNRFWQRPRRPAT